MPPPVAIIARASAVPNELLFFEILARLPLQSLARFKCVCRSWRDGIQNPVFLRRHLNFVSPDILFPRGAAANDGHRRMVNKYKVVRDYEQPERNRVRQNAMSPEKRRPITPPAAAVATAFPDELLFFEILARLPVPSLTRFKCVCRSWLAAIEDPTFVRRHLDTSARAALPPSVVVIPREDLSDSEYEETATSESAWPGGITHLIAPVHCDGLVALSTFTHQVFVCNPATKEFVELPPGSRDVNHDDLPAVALGFHPYRGRYFVARCFYRHRDGTVQDPEIDIGHEIFTLGDGKATWELTQDPPHAIGPDTPVCSREAIYWHGPANFLPPHHRMLRFGLRDETFDVVACPPPCCGGGSYTIVVDFAELDGKLCCVYKAAATAFEVWMAGDALRLEWSLRYRVDVASPLGFLLPVAAVGDEVFVALGFDWLGRYNVRSKVLERVVDLERAVKYGQCTASGPCSIMHYVINIGHEIFALGNGEGTWELTQDPPHAIGPDTPVCTREAIYWHGPVEFLQPHHRMLRFGLRDETFDVVACLPPGCARRFDRRRHGGAGREAVLRLRGRRHGV
ncbi:hypothetical protein EJB05_40506, partial [Eragrostis curvula]